MPSSLSTVNSKWRGSKEIKLQPTYPRFRHTAKGHTITLVFRGPYVDLRTYGPNINDAVTLGAFGYEPDDTLVFANSVECQPDAAGEDGPGTLTVIYTNGPDAGYHLAASSTMTEIDYTILEKPLAQHPIYSTGGTKALTDDDRKKIETWKNAPGTANYNANTANGKHFIDKLRLGIESYIVGAPLVRKTTRNTSPPSVSSVGTRSTGSPATGSPSGYQWLKTADRSIQQAPAAGWERVEEWTGAKLWDADLYTGVI